jgi:MFS family permease
MPDDSGGQVSELLQNWKKGDENALHELLPLVYNELRRLAHYHLQSERPDHTLQSTALVTTTSEFGFLVFLPIFFIQVIGFSLQQWLQVLSIMFATNVVANLIWGWVGDKIGWRRTITFIGSCGCALTTLGLYYVPHHFGANYSLAVVAGMAYGTALAGFVPIGAIMATLAPESRGAAMSIMNLGSGMSTFIGPAIAGVFLPLLGVSGVIWIFASMYLAAAVISFTLRIPGIRSLR